MDWLDELERQNSQIADLLRDYDTSEETTAKFWISAGLSLAGYAAGPVTGGVSLVVAILGSIHAAWSGWDLGRDILDEQAELGRMRRIERQIDAIETEMARRDLTSP